MQPHQPSQTYSVVFHNTEIKFALKPLHPRNRLGAVVCEGLNEYCRNNVIPSSWIIRVNEFFVSYTPYKEVLKLLQTVSAPITITFHACETIHVIEDNNNNYYYVGREPPQTEQKATSNDTNNTIATINNTNTNTNNDESKELPPCPETEEKAKQIDELRIATEESNENRLKQVQTKITPLTEIDTNLPSSGINLSFSPLNPATTTKMISESTLNVSAREFVPKTKSKPKAKQTKTKPISEEKLENVDNSMKASIPACAVKTNAKNPSPVNPNGY